MIITDKEAVARLNSPINLINQIRNGSSHNGRSSAMGLFGIGKKPVLPQAAEVKTGEIIERDYTPIIEKKQEEVKVTFNPFVKSQALAIPAPSNISSPAQQQTEPTLDNLLNDSESQIKLSLAHDSALSLLTNSVAMLAAKLDDVKADKLPAVISAASKTVESIRKERMESTKNGNQRDVHYHFYTPVQKKVSDYEVIEVS